jgi:hypothetical protein
VRRTAPYAPYLAALLIVAAAVGGVGHADAAPAAAGPTVVRYRVRDGSAIDLGWTGLAHQQPWPSEQRVEFTLDCRSRAPCTVGGGAAGAIFGAPIPLSTGGVPACVVSRLRSPLAGSADPATGCGDLHLALTSTVYLGSEVAQPCPRCVGDRIANDGRKDGRCDRGPSAGNACDANAASTLFGTTSNDCLPPPASAVGTLAIDLAPLTTGSVRLVAERDCKLRRPGLADRCTCAEQRQPNECASGVCGADERCEAPIEGVCAGAPFRGCTLGSGAAECEAVSRGAGTCEGRIRPCFGDVISATGSCDRAHPTYVAIFCAPATQAPAINATAGLPGPARLRLLLEALKPTHATVTRPARSPASRSLPTRSLPTRVAPVR